MVRVRISGSPPLDHTARVCVRVSRANLAPAGEKLVKSAKP